FPCPFSPTTRFQPGPKETMSDERLRKARVVSSSRRKMVPGRTIAGRASKPHRHDDVQIARRAVDPALGGAETLRVLVLQLEADAFGLRLVEEVEKVLRVQPDRQRLAVVSDVERLGSLTELLARGGDRQEILLERESDAARPLRREECDASNRGLAGDPRDDGDLVVSLAEDFFVVGKVDVQETRDQLPAADAKEEMVFGVPDLEIAALARIHLQDFGERLLRDEDVRQRSLSALAREIDERQAVSVGRDELELLAFFLEQRA